jgi:SAM-dependent methyltransferase
MLRVRKQTAQRRFQLFDSLLGLFPPGRALDLGAGHGRFSLQAADAGWQMTAVDARSERFPEDPRVTWVQADVRDADLDGYDLVFCLGLFYHLTLPDQLDLLKRVSGTPLILDTHVATPRPTKSLTKPVTVEGYQGRYYSENQWRSRPTASWKNDQSFWPNRESFFRMLGEHGYPNVFAGSPWVTPDRTFFLCLPG